MPKRYFSEKLGSGLSTHTRQRAEYGEDELELFFETVSVPDPISEARRVAEATLDAIAASPLDEADFTPFIGMGWYGREILARCEWLRQAATNADRERWACEVGILWREATLKRHFDDTVQAGERHLTARADANHANRKADHAVRKAVVERILAERSKGKTDAFRVAAERHPEMGKFTSFKESYYKKVGQR